jgi:hypothetical protein
VLFWYYDGICREANAAARHARVGWVSFMSKTFHARARKGIVFRLRTHGVRRAGARTCRDCAQKGGGGALGATTLGRHSCIYES